MRYPTGVRNRLCTAGLTYGIEAGAGETGARTVKKSVSGNPTYQELRSSWQLVNDDDTDGNTTTVGSTTLREQNTLVATVRFVPVNCG
jgi:hypothetical protein